MSFTTFAFMAFFAVTVLLYYILPGKTQKYLLLLANYVFYMWVRPAFGILILAGTLISYFCARAADGELGGKRRIWPVLGIIYTIGVLFVFKYLDFFCGSFMRVLGRDYSHALKLILPVGISFFTFSVAGYLFDVYRGKVKAERSFVDYAVFVAFFPTIMAGPIGYARNFLPQLKAPKIFDSERLKHGVLRFMWGMAKKVIVADTIAIMVNAVYANTEAFTNGILLLAVFAYSIQIYFDFSAYSDMAIGVSEILGFSVMENFNSPYLVRSVKDFWKKWHISLTSWLREYIYFPLGGSRKGKWRTYMNVLIVFAVSGLWHGAAFTFVIWGMLNGIYQVFGQMTLPARKALHSALGMPEDSKLLWVWQCAVTFVLVSIAWVFFRAESVSSAAHIVARLLLIPADGFGSVSFDVFGMESRQLTVLIVYMVPFIIADIVQALGLKLPKLEKTDFLLWGIVLVLALSVAFFGIYGRGFNPQDFVYFKF